MASSDESMDCSSDSEAIKTDIQYDLDPKESTHSSDQDDP